MCGSFFILMGQNVLVIAAISIEIPIGLAVLSFLKRYMAKTMCWYIIRYTANSMESERGLLTS